LNQISEQRSNPERLLSSTLPDEGVGHCGGVLIVLSGGGGGGGGVGGGGRVEALAAGVEDEGVALVGEAEAAVLVHGRLPRAEEEREGDGEEEADGHGVELVRLDLAWSGVECSASPAERGGGKTGRKTNEAVAVWPPRPSVGKWGEEEGCALVGRPRPFFGVQS